MHARCGPRPSLISANPCFSKTGPPDKQLAQAWMRCSYMFLVLSSPPYVNAVWALMEGMFVGSRGLQAMGNSLCCLDDEKRDTQLVHPLLFPMYVVKAFRRNLLTLVKELRSWLLYNMAPCHGSIHGSFRRLCRSGLRQRPPVRSNFSIGDDSLLYLSSSLQVG